ncbi:MAG TPA: sensor domain-containing diguanylate cyclase [Gaiellaceae bacterium]|nr:sensor domain-containing diguanylate cyclase [Gaiellaceae bacterium]
MSNDHTHHNARGASSTGVAARDVVSSLRSLLEITKAVRTGADVDSVLDGIARVIGETLGFETVVLNVYRPEWDDFHVATVHGSEAVREALLGSVYDWGSWTPLLDPRFLRAGAYFIPNDDFDWSQDVGNRFVPADAPCGDGPDAWHPNDELFVPLEDADGGIVGIMSFGDPVDGRRPNDERLEVACALASHAALALEAAQENAEAKRHQAGLEQLLRVSSQLPQTISTEAMLASVCEGVSGALGFEKVLIQLVDDEEGQLRPVAAAGCTSDEVAASAALELEPISRLFQPEFDVAGCYLVPHEEAIGRVGATQVVYRSARNGRGPHAWNHHWLVVPLHDAGGAIRGVLWADEPRSRRVPSEESLQALRIFANHAMEALAVATQLEETRFLADHDPLTRLPNRRALLEELGTATGTQRPTPLALVFLDVDNFKEVNDRHGHLTGDRVLSRFASLLAELVRSGDRAFRVGGDEFALLLHGAAEQEAREVVGRIVDAVEANIDPLVRTLTASFGIAPRRGQEHPQELLRVADEAMYAAKRSGTRIEVAA